LLAASRELATRTPPPSPAEVFSELTAQGGAQRQAPGITTEWKDDAGKRIASLVVDRKGRPTLSFDQPMGEAQRRKLAKMIDAFVGSKA